jgi:hypothetical protein
MGDAELIDSIVHAGLWDAFNDIHMGSPRKIWPSSTASAASSRTDFPPPDCRGPSAVAEGIFDNAGARVGEGYPINLPVPEGSYDDAWVALLEHIVIPAAEEFQPDLILISAGCDAHRDDDQGGCELEGGYALDALAASICATMAALAGDQPPDSVAPDFLTSRAASYIGHHRRL